MAEQPADQIRSFSQLIGALEEGALHHELTQQIQEIVATLNNHRAEYGGEPKGALSIALAFALKGSTIEITGKTTTTLPKASRERTILWTTGDNRLTRQNPKQMGLPFAADTRTGASDVQIV